MSNSKKGLRIGQYRITPLGLGLIGAVILIAAALIVFLIVNPFGSAPDVQQASNLGPRATATAEPNAVATPSATAAPTPKPEPRHATIRALGEIAVETDLLKSAFNQTDGTFDFSPMFSQISDVIGDADYTIADVEGTMGDTMGISGDGSKKMYTPSAILTALKDCGVDMMMLANDHALDGTFAELQATIQNVSNAGMDYVGVASSPEEKNRPLVKDINGIKVGFLAYCESVNGNESGISGSELAYGVNLIGRNCDPAADTNSLRSAGADVIVAFVNWGTMLNRSITSSQPKIAQILNSVGVDVIVGYNPHCVQPALWLESETGHRTLCLCATGNLLSNQRDEHFDCGIIFQFSIQEQADGSFAIENPTYIPTYVLRYERPNDPSGMTLYDYRALAVGQWTDEDAANLPEGMTYSDLQHMASIWSEMQSLLGETCTIARE